jgi:WW domain-containing oxidoreductase
MPKQANGFGYGTTAEEVTQGIDLSGKTILITGCNSGIGKESMRVLALRGAKIIGTGRTKEKVEQAFLETGVSSGIAYECELSNPASIRACIQSLKKENSKIDVLLCNAGIMALPELEKVNGYEIQFFTNHIGHFILVTGLLDTLTEDGRVVMLSSAAHNAAPSVGIEFDNLDGSKSYSAWTAYGQSKLANLLFARELAKKFQGTKRTAYSVHPGVIATNLSRHMNPILRAIFGLSESIFLKSVEEGAATQCYVATNSEVMANSGKYFADCNLATTTKIAQNDELSQKLWKVSEEIVAKF